MKRRVVVSVVGLAVRTPAEFNLGGHIPGAINIDVEAVTFNSKIANLDETKTYAVYCHSGNRSGVATRATAKTDFTHLFNLQNGIADWMSQGTPTVIS
jgi:phage shock protein E